MTKEEFWEKWMPCDYSEHGFGLCEYDGVLQDHDTEKCKLEMFKDLDGLEGIISQGEKVC